MKSGSTREVKIPNVFLPLFIPIFVVGGVTSKASVRSTSAAQGAARRFA
ncbi:MAG: hypothetical protein ACLRSW_14110 [Christensenellaceae bacterium]